MCIIAVPHKTSVTINFVIFPEISVCVVIELGYNVRSEF